MKRNKKSIVVQRKSLDQKIGLLKPLAQIPLPRKGWLKAIRESLGITTRQLAKKIGTGNGNILTFEQGEINRTLTLKTLERLARAMNCRLVYALVPNTSLEEMLDEQARKVAKKIFQRVSHSMGLEEQSVEGPEAKTQFEQMVQDLKKKHDPRLWDSF